MSEPLKVDESLNVSEPLSRRNLRYRINLNINKINIHSIYKNELGNLLCCPNNIHFDFPAVMHDGRTFAWNSSCAQMNYLKNRKI